MKLSDRRRTGLYTVHQPFNRAVAAFTQQTKGQRFRRLRAETAAVRIVNELGYFYKGLFTLAVIKAEDPVQKRNTSRGEKMTWRNTSGYCNVLWI